MSTESTEGIEHLISVEPGRLRTPAAPVEAVIGRARTVRARRRAVGTAVLAVAAAGAVATPMLAGAGSGRDGAADGGGAAVTVNSPKVGKGGGTVFSGSADGKKWSVSVAAGRCQASDGDMLGCLEGWSPGAGVAAQLSSTYQDFTSAPIKYRIRLRPDVARADVDLTDGERLSLTPAKILGVQLAAFEVPRRAGISRVTAYGADGRVIAYSIAYQSPTDALLAQWYRPGETATQPAASGAVTGTVKGVAAKVEVHTGPFGICYTVLQRTSSNDKDKDKVPATMCEPLPTSTAGVPPTGPDRSAMGDDIPISVKPFGNPPFWVALGGLVEDRVDHVDFAISSGTFRAPVVRIGGFSFAVALVDFGAKGFTMIGRTFYDASGHVLAYKPSPVK